MTRLTAEEYRRMVGGTTKPSKYKNNKPTYYDPDKKETITFDSNKELDYYLLLKAMQKKGKIGYIWRQYEIEIQPSFTTSNGEKIRAITYIADFRYHDLDGIEHIVDVKGYKTEVYRIKKKLLAYRGIIIEEV